MDIQHERVVVHTCDLHIWRRCAHQQVHQHRLTHTHASVHVQTFHWRSVQRLWGCSCGLWGWWAAEKRLPGCDITQVTRFHMAGANAVYTAFVGACFTSSCSYHRQGPLTGSINHISTHKRHVAAYEATVFAYGGLPDRAARNWLMASAEYRCCCQILGSRLAQAESYFTACDLLLFVLLLVLLLDAPVNLAVVPVGAVTLSATETCGLLSTISYCREAQPCRSKFNAQVSFRQLLIRKQIPRFGRLHRISRTNAKLSAFRNQYIVSSLIRT